MNDLQDIMDGAREKTILVIGDSMLDEYVYVKPALMLIEADSPIIPVSQRMQRPGAAANAAANVRSLGAKCNFATVLGSGDNTRALLRALRTHGDSSYHLTDFDGDIPSKTRIVFQEECQNRFDYEPGLDISPLGEWMLLDLIAKAYQDCDAVLISDYGRGVVTERVIGLLYELLRQRRVPCVIDAKDLRPYTTFPADVLCPSEIEARTFLNWNAKPWQRDRQTREEYLMDMLAKRFMVKNLIVTQGHLGCLVASQYETPHYATRIPAARFHVANSVGAGDTFAASLAIALACGADLIQAARIATVAAGLACTVYPTHAVERNVLHGYLDEARDMVPTCA